MTKEQWIAIKQDPERLKHHRKKRAEQAKRYIQKKRQNPEWLKQHKERVKQRYRSIKNDPELNKQRLERLRQRWKTSGYKRHRTQVFKRLAKNVNAYYPDNSIQPIDLFRIAKRQRLLCPFTGQKLTQDNMSVDHVVPKSKGGLNIPSNIRLVIKPVNIARQNMTDLEFYTLCQNVATYFTPSPPIGEGTPHQNHATDHC